MKKLPKDIIDLLNNRVISNEYVYPEILINGQWYMWGEGEENSVFVFDKYGYEYEFNYDQIEQVFITSEISLNLKFG